MAQIPWVPSDFVGSMLAKLGNDSILPLARKMVGHRLQAGSLKRDLFHHLVSHYAQASTHPHLDSGSL